MAEQFKSLCLSCCSLRSGWGWWGQLPPRTEPFATLVPKHSIRMNSTLRHHYANSYWNRALFQLETILQNITHSHGVLLHCPPACLASTVLVLHHSEHPPTHQTVRSMLAGLRRINCLESSGLSWCCCSFNWLFIKYRVKKLGKKIILIQEIIINQ